MWEEEEEKEEKHERNETTQRIASKEMCEDQDSLELKKMP
jgi:hypothetical protein